MAQASTDLLSKAHFAKLAAFYRKHLLEDILPFWEARTLDTKHGGYLTGFDMAGHLLVTDKPMWSAGRQLWMFSALYNRVEKRDTWLALAKAGRDFIVKHAYVGKGRWLFKLDRSGEKLEGTISIATDLFILSGLVEYARATGSDQDMKLINETYDAGLANSHDPNFKDVWHGTWDPNFKGRPMLGVHLAGLCEELLGQERTRPWMDECIRDILYTFSLDEHHANFEQLSREGKVIDHPRVRTLNPGHTLECLWFCLVECRRLGRAKDIERAVEVADWTWQRGLDREHGGIFAYLDLYGGEPAQMAYHKLIDQRWDDKSWWVQSETLVTLAMAAVLTKDAKWMERFMQLHDYCQRAFYAPQYGQWYPSLWRDGHPTLLNHAKALNEAYHLPRALLYIMETFQNAAK